MSTFLHAAALIGIILAVYWWIAWIRDHPEDRWW